MIFFCTECLDTKDWTDMQGEKGKNCRDYERQRWCENGFTLYGRTGKSFNRPENNCCSCGKHGRGMYLCIAAVPHATFIATT